MTEERGPARSYRSPSRTEQARRTRSRILEAAHRLFVERGYPATTIRAVAESAGVAVPTVELLFGTKPRLLTSVIDVAIAGDDGVDLGPPPGRHGERRRELPQHGAVVTAEHDGHQPLVGQRGRHMRRLAALFR